MGRLFAQDRTQAASRRPFRKEPRLSVFVDSSMWFASVVARDHGNARAKSILQSRSGHITTDHVLVETWLLLNSRYHHQAAENFWDRVRRGPARIEQVTTRDLEAAW